VVADGSALDDAADDVVALDRLDDQSDLAVVDEQSVAGDGVLSEFLVGGRDAVVVSDHVVDGDADYFTVFPHGAVLGESSEPDLRPLEIGEDADGVPGGLR